MMSGDYRVANTCSPSSEATSGSSDFVGRDFRNVRALAFGSSLCHFDLAQLLTALICPRLSFVAQYSQHFEGTSEIPQLVIARAISGLRIE